jgi:hypothetical protein
MSKKDMYHDAGKGSFWGGVAGSTLGAAAGLAAIPILLKGRTKSKLFKHLMRAPGYDIGVPLARNIEMQVGIPDMPQNLAAKYIRKQIGKERFRLAMSGSAVGGGVGTVLGMGIGAAHGAMKKEASDERVDKATLVGAGVGAGVGGFQGSRYIKKLISDGPAHIKRENLKEMLRNKLIPIVSKQSKGGPRISLYFKDNNVRKYLNRSAIGHTALGAIGGAAMGSLLAGMGTRAYLSMNKEKDGR